MLTGSYWYTCDMTVTSFGANTSHYGGAAAVLAGPCQQPQIQHLLRMSGGIMGFDNCAYKPTEWQTQYCL
jgi:hypothetical protein